MSPPQNLLFLMSDEHLREAAGCYGSTFVQTPNLDKLAARGTRFTNAYTPSPICVPARAALATGRYVHQTRFWSNAQPYDGSIASWGHRLRDAGYHTVSVGKLHYRGTEDDNGFCEEHCPLHVRDGVGWVRGLLRNPPTRWGQAGNFAMEIGPGECEYTRFDRGVRDSACAWLRSDARLHATNGWALVVSFASPHYPLIVPAEYYSLYPLDRIEPPRLAAEDELPTHPVVAGVRAFYDYDTYFDTHTRKVARASYFGLCSFLDDNIGQVLKSLEDIGALENTTVVYTSDHGECIGNHGIWTKCVMYEESAAVPLLLSGRGVPQGEANPTPASLVDCYPTILDCLEVSPHPEDTELPGCSLRSVANGNAPDRTILSEYHDGGSITGMFMARKDHWKYVYYPGYDPELFNLRDDPREARDLAHDERHASVLSECERALRRVVDPDAANERAFADQAAKIEALGGRDAILALEDYDHTPVP
jgi:choline-sulfatase